MLRLEETEHFFCWRQKQVAKSGHRGEQLSLSIGEATVKVASFFGRDLCPHKNPRAQLLRTQHGDITPHRDGSFLAIGR
jgi:hypothetical protein